MPRPVELPIPSRRRMAGSRLMAVDGDFVCATCSRYRPRKSDQPHRQHFRLEGSGKFGLAPSACGRPRRLASTIDSCRAEQIADLFDHLPSGCFPAASVNDMRKQRTDLLARESTSSRPDMRPASCFGTLAESRSICVGPPIAQGECRVPGLGDHPVGSQAVIEFMREGDERVCRLRPTGTVSRHTDAAPVDLENRPVDVPALGFQAAQQNAHEAETALMKGAHAAKPHHLPRWAEVGHRRKARQTMCIPRFSHLPVHSWRQRSAASSRP